MDTPLKSYTSTKTGLLGRLRELRQLYRWHSDRIAAQNAVLVERLREAEQAVLEFTGVRLENLRALEIGPGQKLRQMAYFARRNDVVGIDLDAIVQGLDPLGWWRMLRRNGPVRVLKTLGRKLAGLDRAFARDLAARLGMAAVPKMNILTMNAAKMDFPDASFDFVYSFSVFEHLPVPKAVLDEVVRVLKPGGAAYISLHLYTSDDGCHDPRAFTNDRSGLPHWAHLRPQHADKVRPNAYLNRLRIQDWERLFEDCMPGVAFRRLDYNDDAGRRTVAELRKAGELTGYSDEELLTIDFAAVWRKPALDAKPIVQAMRPVSRVSFVRHSGPKPA